MSMRVIVAAIASCSIHERGRSSELDPKSSEATMTQSFLGGGQGAESV